MIFTNWNHDQSKCPPVSCCRGKKKALFIHHRPSTLERRNTASYSSARPQKACPYSRSRMSLSSMCALDPHFSHAGCSSFRMRKDRANLGITKQS
ncbi:Hypothetical protein NTJ_09665 [Nesidiocoris tenuis]|uniref:Uncharacterized protein n=1 Tax=Nesidiocoris tenuis TaxID=355587 RepID=A0ABN7AXH1_9HEMI|nr:Hypothetical protein NTJ_09665 [Nesidiocoris tenuis]